MVEPALASETPTEERSALSGEGSSEQPKPKQQHEGEAPKPTPGEKPAGEAQPSPDTKGEQDGGEGGEQKPADEPKPKAPESYEFKPTEGIPEGQGADKATLEAWAKTARELDLDNDQAQKVLDALTPEIVRQQSESLAHTHKVWVESTQADKEIGGENFKEAQRLAKKVLSDDRIATPALRELLNGPLGDHPELVRVFARVGRALDDDLVVTPGRGGEDPTSDSAMARKLYKNSPQ